LAKFAQDGVEVTKENINFPFVLHFQPNEAHTEFCETKNSDYKEGDGHFPCLEDLKPGVLLYTVFAVYNPTSHQKVTKDDVVHIGDIISTSEFVKSQFGDNKLHYTHLTFEENLKDIHNEERKQLWVENVTDAFMNHEICDKYVNFAKN